MLNCIVPAGETAQQKPTVPAVKYDELPTAYQSSPNIVYVGDYVPVHPPTDLPHYVELTPRPRAHNSVHYVCHACDDGSFFPDAASLVIHEVMVHGRTARENDLNDESSNDSCVSLVPSYAEGVNPAPPGGWSFVSCPECPCR